MEVYAGWHKFFHSILELDNKINTDIELYDRLSTVTIGIVGKLLTVIDASIEKERAKYLKDIISRMIWREHGYTYDNLSQLLFGQTVN